jgi:hypothetical protein
MAMILKTVGPARGAHWVRDGLRLYLKRPLAFTSLFAIFMFAVLLVALVPFVGGLLQMMAVPLLSLGMMVASQSALLGGPVAPNQFAEPFRAEPAQRRALIGLCVAYGVAVALVLVLADWVADDGFSRWFELLRQQPAPDVMEAQLNALFAERGMVSGFLFAVITISVITVPFWHAPALVHWARQTAAQALFSSALAVWRCRGAFLVYGLTWMALVLVVGAVSGTVFALLGAGALAPMLATGIGLFLSTLFYVSLIFTFNDSFATQ